MCVYVCVNDKYAPAISESTYETASRRRLIVDDESFFSQSLLHLVALPKSNERKRAVLQGERCNGGVEFACVNKFYFVEINFIFYKQTFKFVFQCVALKL